MTDLVNICAPADAPDYAPLLFHKDAPGNCIWGTPEAAALFRPEAPRAYDDSQVRCDVMRLEQQVAALTMKLDQMIAVLNQHEADIGQTRHELAGHTHESLTRRVA